MTNAQLLELSLRARLAQTSSEDVFRHASYRTGYKSAHLGDYQVDSNYKNATFAVRCCKASEAFFWHFGSFDPHRDDNLKCTNDAWALELLIRLRVAQVLDSLAAI